MKRAIATVLLLAACGAPTATTTTTTARDEAASAPRLFTLAQLRDAVPSGRVVELRMQIDGKPTVIEHWEFSASDAEGTTIRSITRDESGTVLADKTATSKWSELYDHGKFPAAATRFEDDVMLTVPAGTWKTRLYTVRKDATTIRRFWFAAELPGPPIQFTTEKDGKTVFRAEMLRAR